MDSRTVSAFDLPDRLSRKADPALIGADPLLAGRAAQLAKADLTTDMVGAAMVGASTIKPQNNVMYQTKCPQPGLPIEAVTRSRTAPAVKPAAIRALIMERVDPVLFALSRDYVSSKPAYDYGNVVGDEGQHPDYFFTWLRSVLRVMELALAEGRAVIHELKV